MKKFLHKLPIWATVLSVLLCSVLCINIQPTFASSLSSAFTLVDNQVSPLYYPYGYIMQEEGAVYSGTLGFYMTSSDVSLPSGYYSVSGSVAGIMNDVKASEVIVLGVRLVPGEDGTFGEEYFYQMWYDFSEVFYIPVASENEFFLVCVQSFTVPNLLPIEEEEPIYYSAFQMLADFIYGEGALLTTEQNLTMTILSTVLSLLVVLLPFIIVYALIILFGRY